MQIRVLGPVDVELEGATGDGPAVALAYSPVGRLLAASGTHGEVGIWDARTLTPVRRLTGLTDWVQAVAFSPDGDLLFVGLFNGAGRLYSTRDWRRVGGFRGQDQRLLSGHFSPDGKTLTTASADGSILLWDVGSRSPIGSPLTIERDNYRGAALSHDGEFAYAIPRGMHGARVALTPESWKRNACAIVGRAMTRREWAEALPDRDYRPICAS